MSKLVIRNDIKIQLIDYMGSDKRVAQAARTSTEFKSTQKPIKRLIRHLIKNNHWSPFEQVFFTLISEIPIFVARQLMRHRSHFFNEYSLRYSEALNHVFVPDEYNSQSDSNKQVRDRGVVIGGVRSEVVEHHERSFGLYRDLLSAGVAREQAREVLPVAVYTRVMHSLSLRSALTFIGERGAWDAQPEIQAYASGLRDVVRGVAPLSLQFFEEFHGGSF